MRHHHFLAGRLFKWCAQSRFKLVECLAKKLNVLVRNKLRLHESGCNADSPTYDFRSVGFGLSTALEGDESARPHLRGAGAEQHCRSYKQHQKDGQQHGRHQPLTKIECEGFQHLTAFCRGGSTGALSRR
jgi:hypothetical protein